MRYIIGLIFTFYCAVSIAQPALNKVYGTETGNGGVAIILEENGYFIAATGFSPKYSTSQWLNSAIKLYRVDSLGNILWENDFGGVNQGWETGGSGCAKQTEDGDYIVSGSFRDSTTGIFTGVILKVDDSGNEVWIDTITLGTFTQFNYGVITPDKGFAAIGETNGLGDTTGDVYLVKTDSNGQFVWQKNYGGDQQDYGIEIGSLPDSGFIISGITFSFGPGTSSNYLIRTDSIGDTVWTRTYGTTRGQNGQCQAQPDMDGGFLMFGTWDSVNMNLGPNYVAKLDGGGNIKWITFVNDSIALSQARELSNGNIIAVGQKDKPPGAGYFYEGYITELDSNGNQQWEKLINFNDASLVDSIYSNQTFGLFYDFQQTRDKGFALTGTVEFVDTLVKNLQEIWLVKTDSTGCLDSCSKVGIEQVNQPETDLRIYPNPAYSNIAIEWQPVASLEAQIVIYDMLGREVISQQINSGKAEINVSGLENGLYVVKVMSPSGGAVGGGILGSAKLAVIK